MDWEALVEAATEVRRRAYAPYSRFAVGAALLTDQGLTFPGCNVENRSYGLTLCAERVAVTAAVAAGQRRFSALVVVTDTTPPGRPCGPCLDTLAEFSDDLPILLVNLSGDRDEVRLGQLLPQRFILPAGGAR